MIRILHTSDWHLGKRLGQNERQEEHALFLNWLNELITFQDVDALILAGDVFDTGNPSNAALKLYYDFLWKIKNTSCRHVVIIGGNHDSVSTLNAPKELLKYLNVYVIGGVPENKEEQIIPLADPDGNLQAIVCAVPFLRDRDIKLSVAGETQEEREVRIKQGVSDYYRQLIPYISRYKKENLPLIATGHLFASGAVASESEKNIHLGNLGQIAVDSFPEELDYVALGHLHRAQLVGKKNHIRYSGAPIALDFSEYEQQKKVLIADFGDGKLLNIEEFNVPVFRKMIRIKGSQESVKEKLETVRESAILPTWIEIEVETAYFIPDLQEQLNELIKANSHIGELYIRQTRIHGEPVTGEISGDVLFLQDLQPETVFLKKCELESGAGNMDELLMTFKEALELMERKD